MTALKYIGKHGAFLDNVPARDLTDDDIQQRELDAAELIASGLYEEEAAPEEYRFDEPEPVKSPRGRKSGGLPIVGDDGPERYVSPEKAFEADRPDWLGMVEDAEEDDASEDGE